MSLRAASVAMVLLIAVAGFCKVRAEEPAIITTVTGTVIDAASQHPVTHAQITFTMASEKTVTESATDGTFSVTLPVGTYELTVHAKGYNVAKRENLVVADQPVGIQVALSIVGGLKTIASVSVRTESAINV